MRSVSVPVLLPFLQCDMSNLMNMRKAYKEDFQKKHGIKLGFMSCFVKASADALREMPAVNGCELCYCPYHCHTILITAFLSGSGSCSVRCFVCRVVCVSIFCFPIF